MACSRCNRKPVRSTILETRYALVNDVVEAEFPDQISSSFKFDDPVAANRLRLMYPAMRVVAIKEYRKL